VPDVAIPAEPTADVADGPLPPAGAHPTPQVPRRRFERERAARKEAEHLLTLKSRELFDALQSSREAERRLQLALWASGEGIWDWRAEDGLLRVDGLVLDAQPLTDPPADLPGVLARVHPDDVESLRHAWRLLVENAGDDIDAVFRVRDATRWRWLRVRGRALLRDPTGRPRSVAGTVKDVTAQREAEHALLLLAQAFSSTRDALAVVDANWGIVQANESFRQLAAVPRIRQGEPLARYLRLPAEAGSSEHWQGECTLSQRHGRALPTEVSLTAVAERAGEGRCFIVVMRDISERRRAARELERMAMHDPLTGLPNRSALDQALVRRIAEGHGFALLFVDLDGFKSVNDGLGHRAGDELLRMVGERLSQALPEAFLARWGGDEFVAIGPRGSDATALDAMARRMLAEIGRPYAIAGHELRVTPSIGGVCSPTHGTDPQTLLRHADAAMYAAKDNGRNQLVHFHAALDAGAQRRTLLHGLLRADADGDGFHFVVQPQVDGLGRHLGAELLMRWSPTPIGPVSPAEFIPIAEQIGVIDRLGRHALRSAARIARDLRALRRSAKIAVNLSPRQLLRPDLVETALDACRAEGADPAWLELELTESALVSDIAAVTRQLVRLRDHGFTLALDDFGTGYSSLSHLRQLPLHKVKIDRSFVRDLRTDPRSLTVLEGIVRLCRSLRLTTVAEGVETADQFEALLKIGVDEFQGFLFARPQSPQAWFEQLRLAGASALPRDA
jgi:diguanylate cyclase (GGDEF)-like protein